MSTAFNFKQERSFKAFVTALLSAITLLAVSTATLFVVAFSEHASADSGDTYSGIAPTHAQVVASYQNVDTAGLLLFESTHLKGALK